MKVHLDIVKAHNEIVKGKITVLKKPFAEQKSSATPRRPKIKAQREIIDHWDYKWNTMIDEIKKEIEAVIG